MEFRVLGPLEVVDDGRVLELGGPKQRALLALLLLESNRVVARDRLIDALWEDSPPETARKALQVHVSQLRKALGHDRLQTADPGYLLRVGDDELDVARFRRLHEQGRLDEALALWRGPPLADVADQRFAQADAARLAELRITCLEERAERELSAGCHAELAGELEALLAEHPLRERLRAQLMLCLYRCGRQADALEVYRAGRAVLVDELGLEPGRALRDLEGAILRQDPALDLAPPPAAPAEPDAARGPFVGRGAELTALLGGLDDAFAGRATLVLLAGEPGIGKSRLAEELTVHARARGARVLVGRCWEAGGAPAYWPWVQSLRAYIREADTGELRAQMGAGAPYLAQIVPEARERFPDLPEPPEVEAESARFGLFDATAEFLRNVAARTPLVLLLDDLHAADAPSLLLLRFVARELGAARILLLCAYRDVDPTPGSALAEMLAELVREPVTRRVALGGLSEEDVADYIRQTAADVTPAELHEETEGNPLFVGELVRLLAVEGRLTVPQSVRDVIARRLTHLSPEANRVLTLASVLGREFALDPLGRVAELGPDALLDVLDEAMTARVVSEVPGSPGGLRFAHVLIRDTLYEGLTTARRVRLHRLAVDALEALYGDEPGPFLAELAHHAVAGSDFERGVRFAALAGDRALALHAYEEAARLYETALDALAIARPGDDRARCDLLIGLGEAETRAGAAPAARRAFLEAAALARRLGLPRELARAASGYGGRFTWARPGDDTELVPLLEEALAAIGTGEVELRARLLARLAGALRDEPSRERRDRLSREAVELARRVGNATALAYALDGRAAAIAAPDTIEECLAVASELRDLVQRSGDRERVANALDHLRTAQVFTGRLDEAEANLDEETRIAEDLRQPVQLWQTYSARAMLALTYGRLDEAEDLIPRALAGREQAFPQVAIPVYRLQRATLFEFRGRLGEAVPELVALVAEYPTRPMFRCALAHAEAVAGDPGRARGHLVAMMPPDALPFDQEWLLGMAYLAETAALLADEEAAAVLYPRLAPWAHLTAGDHPEGIRGAVARPLGLVAPDPVAAERHLEVALVINERMGARPWVAFTQSDLGTLRGDRALLDAAAATYEELEIAPAARGRFWQVSQA